MSAKTLNGFVKEWGLTHAASQIVARAWVAAWDAGKRYERRRLRKRFDNAGFGFPGSVKGDLDYKVFGRLKDV